MKACTQPEITLPIFSGSTELDSGLNTDHTPEQEVLVSEEVYRKAFGLLKDAIGSKNYFSGSIVFSDRQIECRMTVSVIVYRDDTADSSRIANLVPVWWEFHTNSYCGEIPNDFQFSELKKYI